MEPGGAFELLSNASAHGGSRRHLDLPFMRVIHVYKSYYPDSFGGIEQVIYQLARGLRLLGVESRILTLSPEADPPLLHRQEGDVFRVKTTAQVASNPVAFGAMRAFREQLEWADVVHYQFPWPFADFLHMLHGGRIPSVVTYQSDIVRQKYWLQAYRPLMRRFLCSMDAVVATSPNYVNSSPVLATLDRTIDIVPNGIDENVMPTADPRVVDSWRERLGDGFFLFVGVLRYYKGIHVLLEAARNVNRTVVVAGAGPELADLQSMAKGLKLDHVHFVGEISDRDKVALYTLADAFVFPSNLRSEAFGMSLAEASLFGKPMITCEIGTGTSFINQNGVTGWTVPPDDPASLAQAMRRFIDEPESVQRMGLAARQRYESFLTGRSMAAAYLRIYQRIVNARAMKLSPDRDNTNTAVQNQYE